MPFLIPLALAGLCQTAQADGISSVYTDLDWKKDCVTYAQAEEGDGDWASLACSGYRGYPVLVAYDDARESLFYGFPSSDMTAVWESFSGFNSAGPKVEWRIETKGDIVVPFAVIHRRSISNPDDENKPTEVLLVAKVAQPETHERLHRRPGAGHRQSRRQRSGAQAGRRKGADLCLRQGQARGHRQRAGFRPRR